MVRKQIVIPTLANGPHVVVGTMQYHGDTRYKPEDIHKVVLSNLKAGVRCIDTAELYKETNRYVNLAIRDSKIPRKQLLICSKIKGLPIGDYAEVKGRVTSHLKELGLKYLDMLLVHWPGLPEADLTGDPEKLDPHITWELFDNCIDEAWANMSKLKAEGLVLNIGVSNFYPKHFKRLQECDAAIADPPVMNQIHLDAIEHQFEFVESMQKAGIQVMAYRPLQFLSALKTASEMGDKVYPELKSMLKDLQKSKFGLKSVEQLVVCWLLSRGIHVCVKSSNFNHIKENVAAKALSTTFPEDLKSKFPKRTDLAYMVLAYDAYAEKFQAVD